MLLEGASQGRAVGICRRSRTPRSIRPVLLDPRRRADVGGDAIKLGAGLAHLGGVIS